MELNDIPEVNLFSDGGAEPNPGKGGFGVILSHKGVKKEFSKGYILTTNNRMELMGVIYGLGKLNRKSIVHVFTDSQYVINGISKGWAEKWKSNNWFRTQKTKAINYDLWSTLLDLISQHEEVHFNWIKGHSGHIENERCDELANLALNSDNLIADEGYLHNDSFYSKNINVPLQNLAVVLKIEKEGDLCRKCGTAVIKIQSSGNKIKTSQSYYYEYYFSCPNCKTSYLVGDAKRKIK